jgi:hypothetical protein
VAMRWARDTTEEKLPRLAVNVAAVDWLWVAVEEQCKRLVLELTLLNLRGFELCMTKTDALSPPRLARGNAVCGFPPHRGGYAATRALGGSVSGLPVHTGVLTH